MNQHWEPDGTARGRVVLLHGTNINNQGGTVDTPVFPWEWGSSDN